LCYQEHQSAGFSKRFIAHPLKITSILPICLLAERYGETKMKVTNQDLTGSSTTGTSSAQEIQKSGSGSNSNAKVNAAGDSVELSSTLGSLSRAMESYGSSRQSMVQSLAAQYQSGTYKVDSAAVSRGMISAALGG
jgi:anti-sigma28 factor (negative regulator of flagellin synthesis)